MTKYEGAEGGDEYRLRGPSSPASGSASVGGAAASTPTREEDEDVTGCSSEAKHPSDVIGNWGPVQRRIVFFLTLVYVIAPFNNTAIIFYLPKQDFFCQFLNQSTGSIVSLKNTCTVHDDRTDEVFVCSNFTYDDAIYQRTLVAQFDLVCGKSYYGSIAQSMHQIGYAISGNLLGYLSDRYGRLNSAYLSLILEIIAGYGQAFAPTIYWFWFARLFLGIAAYGRFLTGYVLIIEWVGPKLRPKAAVLYEFGEAFGNLLVVFFFWLKTDYFVMQTVTSSIEIVILVAYVFLVWESPRWLLTHGCYEKVEHYLTKAAIAKGRYSKAEIGQRIHQLKINSMKQFEAESDDQLKKQNIMDVWRVPALLKLSLILYYTWCVGALIGYGSTYSIGSLGGSLFISFTILSSSAALTTLLASVLIDRFPRKKFLITMMFVTVVMLIGLMATSFSEDLYILRIIIFFVFNAARSTAVKLYYLYTAETFPTTMRQTSIGTCGLFSRIGSVSAPFVKELADATHFAVVLAMYTVLASSNLILLFLIPEIGQIQLPDTIEQKKREVECRERRLSEGGKSHSNHHVTI